jgi:hypothetical protein
LPEWSRKAAFVRPRIIWTIFDEKFEFLI